MRKFTPTEIDLCKKIAEKKKIGVGDFFIDTFDKKKEFVACHTKLFSDDFVEEFGTPLWQEHDCLEWLIRKGYSKILNFINYENKGQWTFIAENFILENPYNKVRGEGKTPLEALLRAVLAVMEGK